MSQNKGLLDHWQPLVGLASFLVGVGIFYSENKSMREKIVAMEGRYTRQFQMINEMETRINDLEKRAEYKRGFDDGKIISNEKK